MGKKQDNKVSAVDVLPWARKKKRFTTKQLAEHTGVTFRQATALVAILRIKEALTPDGKGKDGSSQWIAA